MLVCFIERFWSKRTIKVGPLRKVELPRYLVTHDYYHYLVFIILLIGLIGNCNRIPNTYHSSLQSKDGGQGLGLAENLIIFDAKTNVS